MSATRLSALFLSASLLTVAAAPVWPAERLVVDLSDDEIAITTGFTGTELLLFGAKEERGDVVVVLRGPVRDAVVRRRERFAGVWVNRESVVFRGVPAYYRVASTQDRSRRSRRPRRLPRTASPRARSTWPAPPKFRRSGGRRFATG